MNRSTRCCDDSLRTQHVPDTPYAGCENAFGSAQAVLEGGTDRSVVRHDGRIFAVELPSNSSAGFIALVRGLPAIRSAPSRNDGASVRPNPAKAAATASGSLPAGRRPTAAETPPLIARRGIPVLQRVQRPSLPEHDTIAIHHRLIPDLGRQRTRPGHLSFSAASARGIRLMGCVPTKHFLAVPARSAGTQSGIRAEAGSSRSRTADPEQRRHVIHIRSDIDDDKTQ